MPLSNELIQLDLHASAQQQRTYTDPNTNYKVFSSYGLRQRKDCCGCGCRHCPFGHDKVPESRRKEIPQNPWIENDDSHSDCDVLSWSGGKDSYLALRALQKQNQRPIVLLNTFDGRTEKVAHQDLHLSTIRKQAQDLGLPLLLTPLYPNIEYQTRLAQGLLLLAQNRQIHRLAFGDLHLEYVRQWREKELQHIIAPYKTTLCFPIWKKSYQVLLEDLLRSPAKCHISAIADETCKQHFAIGDVFDQNLIEKLPLHIDSFGENGEFHTCISF